MASAGPYASLHLATDRQPYQHPTTQFFTGRCPSCCPTYSAKSLKARQPSCIHMIQPLCYQLRFYAPLQTKYVIAEKYLPANRCFGMGRLLEVLTAVSTYTKVISSRLWSIETFNTHSNQRMAYKLTENEVNKSTLDTRPRTEETKPNRTNQTTQKVV